MQLETRTANLGDARSVADWAAAEGWQPGIGDIDAFHAADPRAMTIGLLDGQLAASLSVASYSPGYLFSGYYIVREDVRAHGLGHEIVKAVTDSVDLDRSIVGCDGVPAQVGTYEVLGFSLAHWTDRWSGDVQRIIAGLAAQGVAPASPLGPDVTDDALVAFDAEHVPAPRPRFAEQWYRADSPRQTFAVRDGERIIGLATVRPSLPDGARIGPLFAHDVDTAKSLLRACAETARPWLEERGGDLMLDIPEPNSTARSLAEGLTMTPAFRCARMYRGGMPSLPLDRIYGNTSFELG